MVDEIGAVGKLPAVEDVAGELRPGIGWFRRLHRTRRTAPEQREERHHAVASRQLHSAQVL